MERCEVREGAFLAAQYVTHTGENDDPSKGMREFLRAARVGCYFMDIWSGDGYAARLKNDDVDLIIYPGEWAVWDGADGLVIYSDEGFKWRFRICAPGKAP